MRAISGFTSALLVVLGVWMLPERLTVLDLPMTMRISSVVLPLLVVLAGMVILAWNVKKESDL